MGTSEEAQVKNDHPAAIFRSDLPLRAWVFTAIVSLFNAAAVYASVRYILPSGLSVGSVVSALLSGGLVAFTFGAVREGMRLERELLKARLEAIIGTLAK